MDRSLAPTASPSALPEASTGLGAGLGIALGACALGLAGAGLMTVAGETPDSSGLLLVGASLVASAAAGFVAFRGRATTSASSPQVDVREVLELLGDEGDGVWDYNLRTQQIVYNATCATMLGYAQDEITSTLSQWGTLVHDEDLPRARRALDDYLEGRSDNYRVQVRMRRSDGGWTNMLDCGRIVARDEQGRPTRACGMHRVIPDAEKTRDVAATLTADLDQALAGLLGQATLASAPGQSTELERAAWRCVGLANRLKLAADDTQATTAVDVRAATRRIVADAEQWTPDRVVFAVRCDAAVETEVLDERALEGLLQLCLDDAVERVDLEGGQVSLRLWRAPHLVVSIAVSPAQMRHSHQSKRLEAIESLAFRHGVEVTCTADDLRLSWPLSPA